jgi:hypothetical protein
VKAKVTAVAIIAFCCRHSSPSLLLCATSADLTSLTDGHLSEKVSLTESYL